MSLFSIELSYKTPAFFGTRKNPIAFLFFQPGRLLVVVDQEHRLDQDYEQEDRFAETEPEFVGHGFPK